MQVTPRTPPGTLELLPREQVAFQHLLEVIRRGYERFGFLPIETPVFELKDVLLTKSGGETEKQVYLVSSTGQVKEGREAELALRFDLTVPLARYVAEHEAKLVFPFRRYQIQRVYRGERPQRGRSREFYQCDIDVIGKDKLDPIFDAEIPAIIAGIFEELDLGGFTIHFSNRKVLFGLLSSLGVEGERQTLVLREIDKLDKIGADKVRAQLTGGELGLAGESVDRVLGLIGRAGGNRELLGALSAEPTDHAAYRAGVAEIGRMLDALEALGVPETRIKLDLAIARGLDYYTGTVYETFLEDQRALGSVCSGGRYEDLAGLYTKSKLPGVGISIGATRLFDHLRTTDWVKRIGTTVQALCVQLDPAMLGDVLALAADLRRAGLNVEAYLEPAKLDKQMKYADRAGIPRCLIYGPAEKERGVVVVKDLAARAQVEIPRAEIAARLVQK
jgi:histidyl-tRNA synthetase